MKQTIILVGFLILHLIAQATECVDRYFTEQNVNIYLCQNYSNYRETTSLLFKARNKVLNDYIEEKIKTGQLLRKKFEIQIYDQRLTNMHLELTQGKKGYYINLSGFPTIEQLLIIIDSYSNPKWKPFFTSDYQNVSSEMIKKQIDKFYSSTTIITHKKTVEDSFSVWTNENVHLVYLKDSLFYFIGKIPLHIKATSSLPVKIKDRVLFLQADSLFVFKKSKMIQRFRIDKPATQDYDIYVSKNWINICEGGEDNWVFSYSCSRNKFYIKKER